MLALSDILKNSKRYGVKLLRLMSRALARVRLDSPVDISQLADMAGASVSKLKIVQCGRKGSTLGASGAAHVMVPQKHAAQLGESLVSGDSCRRADAVSSRINTPLTVGCCVFRRHHFRDSFRQDDPRSAAVE